MQKRDAAAFLAGVSQTEGSQASAPTNLHVISGEVGTRSEDGKTTVAIDGLVFSEADDQYVEMDTLGGLEEGDVTTVILTGESGHAMTPLAIGSVGSVDTIRDKAEAADGKSTIAQTLAQAAKTVAEAVSQHFWTDSDGVHVTEVTEDEWKDDEEGSTTYHSGANVLINSIGQVFRDGMQNLLALLPAKTSEEETAIAIFDGNGNDAENIVASFSANETHIGRGTGTVYLANDTFTMSAEHSPTDVDPDQIITAADLSVSDSTSDYDLFSNMNISMSTKEGSAADTYTSVAMEAYADKNMGDHVLPVSRAGISSYAYADGSDSTTLIYADNVQLNGNKVTFKDPSNANGRLQLGNPTVYQNNGEYAITTAGIDTLHNGPRVTIPAGYYIFVGQWTFNSASASGDRNMQVGFRSGSSGSLWGERVRIRQSSGNFNALNVSALRRFTSETTVYLAGSASITSGKAACYITVVRLN